ncbi:DUF1702 family protein [Tautonia rosea]|uniref:DUF1702 family protein n=1 Tax=Tautonia rosea TaxID=2728037 RepID=UPI0014764835|nr:DUF1702 family protein [Tautonia rosea]
MGISTSRFRRALLGIRPEEATFHRRGFHDGCPQTRRHLEAAGEAFLLGYAAALDCNHSGTLGTHLNAIQEEWSGFAFEGAAMALALLDAITPWDRSRIRRFLEDHGERHVYMIHVGIGWAWARLRTRIPRALRELDPVLGWLAVDGYGFHQGYFHWPRFVIHQERPRIAPEYARRAFDQGLGRSLWFIDCADIPRIASRIGRFSEGRREDLWAGVGLASAYAGGARDEVYDRLREAAEPYTPAMAQGAAFAAEARLRAGNPTGHTELACRVLCRRSASSAAEITRRARDGLEPDADIPAFEVWRQRIQARFCATSIGGVP